jgi:hypothetical protein
MANALPPTHDVVAEEADYEEPTKDRAATFLSIFFPIIVFCLFLGFVLMITLVSSASK